MDIAMLSQTEVSGEQTALREAGLSPEEKTRIGKVVIRLRQRRKLSQLTVARAMGVSRSHLCNIEAGRSRPSATQLISLAGVLNTSVDAILDGNAVADGAHRAAAAAHTGGGKTVTAPCPHGYSLEDRLLLTMLRALSEHHREQIAMDIVRLIQTTQTER